MYIHEPDAHNHTNRGYGRRMSTSSSSSTSTSEELSYATAAESVQRTNSPGGSIDTIRAMSPPQPGRPSTALGNYCNQWLGEVPPHAGRRAEAAELDGNPDRQPRPNHHFPTVEGAWQQTLEEEDEAWDEVGMFLRQVTPPPTNYMSVPTEPHSPTTMSTHSSIRRRDSKKKGPLARCLMFLKGESRQKPARKPSVKAPSPLARAVSRKHKRPPRITLPDTAVSGRTVDGHRHIAISIPVEHAHLSPPPRNIFSRLNRRTKSLPFVEASAALHKDAGVRPMSAFANETHMATQLRPVAEERGSPPWRAREEDSLRVPDEERRGVQASRNTFGPGQEEAGRKSMSPPRIPRRFAHRYDTPSVRRPSTSQADAEARELAHMQALAALSRPQTAPRPQSGQSSYSFRSFATPSPSTRILNPVGRNSLRSAPSDSRRPRAPSNSEQRGFNRYSQGSSRDQHTLQESIFSEHSYLGSMVTAESPSEMEASATAKPLRVKRFSGIAGVANYATPPVTKSEGQDGTSKAVEDNEQDTRTSSGQQKEVSPTRKRRDSGASVFVNPEVKSVKAHITRPAHLHQSVEIVLESPTEASWADETGGDNENDRGDSLEVTADGLSKEKGKAPEERSMLEVPGENKLLKGKSKERPLSQLVSPEQREERRKELLLSRERRIAELRKALENPGTEPKDLLWKRRLSNSSDGSAIETQSTEKDLEVDKRKTLTNVPAAPEKEDAGNLKTNPTRFSFSAVMTVADVRPSSPRAASPELGIAGKEALPPSASPPATVATMVKASPISPYQSLADVTPPESPPLSHTSSSPVSATEAQSQETPLQSPPLKRLNSFRRRQPSALSGRRSPTIQGGSQPRPASKGLPPSTIHSGRQGPEEQCIKASTSALKISRSESFRRYEAMRDEQTQDIERRLKRLEKSRDQWMSSLLPLLADMSQTLGRLSPSKGGKVLDREEESAPEMGRHPSRPRTNHGSDRRTWTWGRDSASQTAEVSAPAFVQGDRGDNHPVFEDDHFTMPRRRPHTPTGGRSRSGTGTSTPERPRRPYPLDEAARLRGISFQREQAHNTADDEQRHARSSSLGASIRGRHRRARTASIPLPPEAASLRAAGAFSSSSGVDTLVGGSNGAGGGSGTEYAPQVPAASPPPAVRRGDDVEAVTAAGRIERLKKFGGRVDARMRSLSLGGRSAREGPPAGLMTGIGSQSDVKLDDPHAASATSAGGYNGMETLEGLMRELQFDPGQSGVRGADARDARGVYDEAWRVREAPRAVVGFGAFSS